MNRNIYHFLITIFLIFTVEMMTTTNGLTTGNLIKNGNFSQIGFGGQPVNWNVSKGAGNVSIEVISNAYLGFHAIELSIYSYNTAASALQHIQLEQGTNKTLLTVSLWRRTLMAISTGSLIIEFYNSTNSKISSNYLITWGFDQMWAYIIKTAPIPTGATNAKIIILMYHVTGKVLLTNLTVEQVDSTTNGTFFVSPTTSGALRLEWQIANNGTGVSSYAVYRGTGILSALNCSTDLLVTFPTQSAYGINIYESKYIDNFVRSDQIYTYQVLALNINGTILDQTDLKIGQPMLHNDYHNIAMLIAFPRTNGIYLSWRLKANSTAKNVTLYNGIDHISNVGTSTAQLIGTYPVVNLRAIVSLSYNGPFLLVSDDGNNIATAKLANLTHPRITFTADNIAMIRQQLQQSRHAMEAFKGIMTYTLTGSPSNSAEYGYKARYAAFIYLITGNQTFVDIAYASLRTGRINYTVYDGSSIKLGFGMASTARAQAFDWAYHGFTLQQRQELIKDFQYSASLFSNYDDDHSIDNNDKASNWVAIVKSGELHQHIVAYNEDNYSNDQAERRILFLLNEIKLHLDHSYGPSGYMQEGMGYLYYTSEQLCTAVYSARDVGISALDQSYSRPDWPNFLLHLFSLRKDGSSPQFGVGVINYFHSSLLSMVLGQVNDTGKRSALRWMFDRVTGINSTNKQYDGNSKIWAILFYPYSIQPQNPSIVFPQSSSMLIDNVEGFYAFRNRYKDENDVLIALSNRNRVHSGWLQAEQFSLSIFSHATIWTQMPGKAYNNISLFSVPYIDGFPKRPINNGGYTRNAKAFHNQGGGYVSLDSSRNFNITLAQRDIFVDMITRDNIETIIAISDQFNDNFLHNYTWQLSATDEVKNITLGYENNLPTFVFTGNNGSWFKGWLFQSQGVHFTNVGRVLRVDRTGFTANFQIVIAIGIGIPPIGTSTDKGINITDVCVDFDSLSEGPKCPTVTTSTPIAEQSRSLTTIVASISGTLGGLAILAAIIIGCIGVRKKLAKTNRIHLLKAQMNVKTRPIK